MKRKTIEEVVASLTECDGLVMVAKRTKIDDVYGRGGCRTKLPKRS